MNTELIPDFTGKRIVELKLGQAFLLDDTDPRVQTHYDFTNQFDFTTLIPVLWNEDTFFGLIRFTSSTATANDSFWVMMNVYPIGESRRVLRIPFYQLRYKTLYQTVRNFLSYAYISSIEEEPDHYDIVAAAFSKLIN
jgi:hypothetical protein